MNKDSRIISDTECLAELLIDSGILTGKVEQCQTEVGKYFLEIGCAFEENPRQLTFGKVQDLVSCKDSQIGNKRAYLAHVQNTAGILRSLTIQLEAAHPDIELPHPDEMYAHGLVHDLDACIVDYNKTGQQIHQFVEYLLARRFDWQRLATSVALHSVYPEAVKLLTQGAHFPKEEAFQNLRTMLQNENQNSSLSYQQINSEFKLYLEGKENLPLILLTVSDYSENGQPYFDPARFKEDFTARNNDITERYHDKPKREGKIIPLIGQALVKGGAERISKYKDLVSTLLENDAVKIELLKRETRLFNILS